MRMQGVGGSGMHYFARAVSPLVRKERDWARPDRLRSQATGSGTDNER